MEMNVPFIQNSYMKTEEASPLYTLSDSNSIRLTWRYALVSGGLVVGPLLAHLAVLAVVVDAAAGAVAFHLEKVAVVRHHGDHPREQMSHVL